MKNKNIQFKATTGLVIPLLIACLGMFVSAATSASARDQVPFNGTVSGYVETQEPVDECTVHTHVINFGNANELGAFHGRAEFYQTSARTLQTLPTLGPFTGLQLTGMKSTGLSREIPDPDTWDPGSIRQP
jgi:hypothetical protein